MTSAWPCVSLSEAAAPQRVMPALSQRPAALTVLGEPSGPPAWKAIPSWYLLPAEDHAIGTDVELAMAKRSNAKIVRVKGASHVVFISHPGVATRLILRAARATS